MFPNKYSEEMHLDEIDASVVAGRDSTGHAPISISFCVNDLENTRISVVSIDLFSQFEGCDIGRLLLNQLRVGALSHKSTT